MGFPSTGVQGISGKQEGAMDSSSFLEWDPELNLKKKKSLIAFLAQSRKGAGARQGVEWTGRPGF